MCKTGKLTPKNSNPGLSRFENLTVKKIPKAVLKKCEWGHDDYSLEIENLPDAPPEVLQEPEAAPAPPRKLARKAGKRRRGEPLLFDVDEAGTKGGQ